MKPSTSEWLLQTRSLSDLDILMEKLFKISKDDREKVFITLMAYEILPTILAIITVYCCLNLNLDNCEETIHQLLGTNIFLNRLPVTWSQFKHLNNQINNNDKAISNLPILPLNISLTEPQEAMLTLANKILQQRPVIH